MSKEWMAATATVNIDGVESQHIGVFSKNRDSNGKHDTICLVSKVEHTTEDDIDRAFLFAAAPELLEAAKEVLERIRYDNSECVSILKKAINKAYGIEELV